MVKVAWPVLGSIYVVSVVLAGLDWKDQLDLGPITALAWVVTVVGALAFIAWALARVYEAVTGTEVGV